MTGLPFQLELTHPALLAGLVALPIVFYYAWRTLVDFDRWQRRVSMLLRAAIILLLVLALAGLTLLRPTREQFVVFAVDKSLSVGDDSRRQAEAFVDESLKHAGSNRSAFLSFASRPGAVETDRAKAAGPLDDRGTDIESALEVAAAAIPPFYVPKIVLISDGNETAGDALKAALGSRAEISTVPLKTRDDPEVQVSAVNVPAQVAQGEPFFVEVVIDSNHDDEGQIEVFRGPHQVISERRAIKKGENRFRFAQSTEGERMPRFTARLTGFKDTLLDNNADFGLVFASGQPRVLLVESDPDSVKQFAWAMEEEGIAVDARPAQGMPESLAELANYELVILSNVPATALTARQMELARTYVQDLGGGLIMLGGDQSFGLGGYYKTVMEEILPVRSDFEKEKEKPSLAMVLIIDKSGSMGGDKIELAKDAAKSAVELLGPSDKIGVIAFEGETFWISEIGSAADKGSVIDRISSIEAGGGTDMYPAMEEAYGALNSTIAKLKHVIILTDGISAPGDFDGISQSMNSARMTISTVGVGEGCDQNLLEEIARIGNGRYYFTDDPLSVPQIFAKETMTASKSAINEQPFIPQVVRPTPVLADLELEAAPFLLGYVITRPKPTSEVILATESGDPLLAWWRYGLGMSAAFTSDAKGVWAAEWLSWPGYSKFWAQVVRHTMRKGDSKGSFVEVKRQGRKATVTLDSVDPSGRYINNAVADLTIVHPDLGTTKIKMTQTAPGRYAAEFDAPRQGAYHLEMSQQYQGRPLYRQSRALVVGYDDELRLRPTNEDRLRAIARAAGGSHGIQAADVFAPTDATAQRATPLWPYLIIAALALFVADVAFRRIDFSLLWSWRKPSPKPKSFNRDPQESAVSVS